MIYKFWWAIYGIQPHHKQVIYGSFPSFCSELSRNSKCKCWSDYLHSITADGLVGVQYTALSINVVRAKLQAMLQNQVVVWLEIKGCSACWILMRLNYIGFSFFSDMWRQSPQATMNFNLPTLVDTDHKGSFRAQHQSWSPYTQYAAMHCKEQQQQNNLKQNINSTLHKFSLLTTVLEIKKNSGCPDGKCRTISGNQPFILPKIWLPEQSFGCLGQPGNC